MPGIVGLSTRKPRQQAEAELQQMLKAICHESFYESGTWSCEQMGIYVGWATPKGAFSDGMPLSDDSLGVTLIFSGEEFSASAANFSRGVQDHETKGPYYLLQCYRDDSKFPVGLNGRFNGLVVDRARQTARLFNDRYGMHRVYYHESGDTFYFAAEAKAILAVRPELRTISPVALGEFVSCGCVMENRTLFPGISVLPPASDWVLRDGTAVRKGSYFCQEEWQSQSPLGPEEWYEELKEAFSRNLPRYFVGRQKVGISLTGGLDTRMIMAWHKSPPQTTPCYSFGGPYRDCQDVKIARRVAAMCGQTHVVIPVGSEFLSQFSKYAERTVYLGDGCTNVGLAADLYVNEKVRHIAPIRITGNYGSEVLRWAPAFKPSKLTPGLFSSDFIGYAEAAGETYRRQLQGHPVSFAVFRQAPWHHYGLLGLEQTQISLRTPYLDNDFVRTVFRAPKPTLGRRDTANVDVCLRLIKDGDSELRRLRTDRGWGGHDGALANATRHLLEFTFKAEYAYDYGMPQWVARGDHLMSALHLERIFLGRHKFTHYRVWYRDVISAYVKEMLLDPITLSRPYLQRSTVEAVVNAHIKGYQNHTTAIHQLLTLELIHRLFVD